MIHAWVLCMCLGCGCTCVDICVPRRPEMNLRCFIHCLPCLKTRSLPALPLTSTRLANCPASPGSARLYLQCWAYKSMPQFQAWLFKHRFWGSHSNPRALLAKTSPMRLSPQLNTKASLKNKKVKQRLSRYDYMKDAVMGKFVWVVWVELHE